jgi:hypothetical protein
MNDALAVLESAVDDVPEDKDGAGVFSAHEQHLRTIKIALVMVLGALVIVSIGATASYFRPPQVTLIRVDDVLGAQLIIPGKAGLTVKEGEVRTALWHWCIWRYRILKSIAKEDFKLSYVSLSQTIKDQHREQDVKRVAAVLAGTEPEQTVDVRSIAIPPLQNVKSGNRTMFRGSAEITLITNQEGEKQPWLLKLEFVVDPIGAAKAQNLEYQILNPLGITITGYYETQQPTEG